MRQVEEALARQVIYGGDLATNLMEVARVDEATLTLLIAQSMDLPPAPAGELPIAQSSVRALVPPEMAVARAVVPLAREGEKLVLAVAEPLPREIEEQLGFALGLGIDQRVAAVVRVRQAISRVYGVPLERRMQRLVARLSGEPASAHGSMPPPLGAAPHVPEAPRPPSAPPPRTTSRSFPAVRPPSTPAHPATQPPRKMDSAPPSAPLAVEHRVGLLQREPTASARPAKRRRGPITLDAAKDEAEEAGDRDALLDLYFDFSRQFFDYAALFLVHGDIAEGRDAFGTGASRDKVVGIGVPLDLPGVMSAARDKRAAVIAKVAADGLDAVLMTDLQRPRAAEVAIVPLIVRTRAVALLVGDCGDQGIDRASVHSVTYFAGVIGKAFERIIVRRKLEGFIAGSRGAVVGKVDPGLVAPKKKTIPPPAVAPAAEVTSPAPPPVVARPASPAPPVVSNRPRALSAPPPAGSVPPPSANIASVRAIPSRPIPREEPESPPPTASRRRAQSVPPPPVVPAAPVTPAPPRVEPPTPMHPRPASAPTVDMLGDEDPSALFDELGWEPDEPVDGIPAPPPSAAIAVPAHAPANRHHEREALPSVIVDHADDVRALVDRVVAGEADELAEGELLRLGEKAMKVIMTRFPGPVTYERSRIATVPNPPRASDCGPVLRLVARQRKVALPFVLERLGEADSEVRGWATHLLAELPYIEALPDLLVRLQDIDPATRVSAALAIASVARSSPDEVIGVVHELARAADPNERCAAMRAMAELRDPAHVPELVRALGDGDETVVEAARAALVLVTRQDLGGDARRWVKWWEMNALRHRVEWLIDALTHEVSEIRRAAGEELKALTKEYFGYAADLPARDRERAQQRYRDWWITEGKARFRRKP